MKKIFLKQDSEGNFLVDITGLIYLVHENCLKEGTPVYMIEKNGLVTEYCLEMEKMGKDGKGYALLMMEDSEEPLYLEFDSYALAAQYFILQEDVELDKEAEVSGPSLTNIGYEEALRRLTKGETVYLKEDDELLVAKTAADSLFPENLLEGVWYRKDTEPPKQKQWNPSKVDQMLMKYLGMDEEEYRRVQKELKKEEEEEPKKDIISYIPLDTCHEVLRTLEDSGILSIEAVGDLDSEGLLFSMEEFDLDLFSDFDGDSLFDDFFDIDDFI